MSNMSYCRFENTLHDLWDCEEHINDLDLSKKEWSARNSLIKTCKYIVENSIEIKEEELEEE